MLVYPLTTQLELDRIKQRKSYTVDIAQVRSGDAHVGNSRAVSHTVTDKVHVGPCDNVGDILRRIPNVRNVGTRSVIRSIHIAICRNKVGIHAGIVGLPVVTGGIREYVTQCSHVGSVGERRRPQGNWWGRGDVVPLKARQSDLNPDRTGEITVTGNSHCWEFTKVSVSIESLLDALHRKVCVSPVHGLKKRDLGISGEIYVLSTI